MEEVVSAIREECLSLVPTNSIVPEVHTESDSGNGLQRKKHEGFVAVLFHIVEEEELSSRPMPTTLQIVAAEITAYLDFLQATTETNPLIR